jgi:hypothetical protein
MTYTDLLQPVRYYLIRFILSFEIQSRNIGLSWFDEIRNNFCFALVIDTRRLQMS